MGTPAATSLVALIVETARAEGVDLSRVGLAWARATPAVVIVPAFGLRALPAAARGALALGLAVVIYPAVHAAGPAGVPLPLALLGAVVAGLPVALAAAVPLWAATMAGGVADALRGASETRDAPTVEAGATPLGVLFSLLASGLFFATGGPARIAGALARSSDTSHLALRASEEIAQGVTIAVALGAPLLAAAVVVEVAGALIARAATPAQLHLTLAPLRALTLLGVLALVLAKVGEALAGIIAHAPA
jgi:type III secretory pathway component EscT